MERLTRKNNDKYLFTKEYLEKVLESYEVETVDGFETINNLDTDEAIHKLGQVEDIMEYWGIDTIDELNYRLNINKYLEDNKVLEKALELACKYKIPEGSGIQVMFCDTGVQVDTWQELRECAIEQAKKELR